MSSTLVWALVCAVLLAVITAYFFLGSLPLLTLRYDTPMDARFVRSFFRTYFLMAMGAAAATAVGLAVDGRPMHALEAAAFAAVAFVAHRGVLPAMDRLQARIQAEDAGAISRFRRIHGGVTALIFLQLVIMAGSLIEASMRLHR